MKNYYTILLLFLISFTAQSQNKPISVEVNYPLEMAQGFDEVTGIANVGVKYRFAQGELFTYGASLSADYLRRDYEDSYVYRDRSSDFLYYHIGGFAEMTIPSAGMIHPFAGVGFSYLIYDYYYFYSSYEYDWMETRKERNPGFNLNFGIQVDLSSSFFLQSYFQFIRTYDKPEIRDEMYAINTDILKVGIGYRF